MDLLTRIDLEALGARRDDGAAHVTLYLPTHRASRSSDARTDPLRWKNLLTETGTVLAATGMPAAQVSSLLSPAWALHEDGLAWQYVGDGLAMFLRPGWSQTLRLPIDVPELAAVGDHFVVGPLLPMVAGDDRFLVLCVSQRSVRLLRGSRHRVRDVELTDIPTNLREVVESPPPRSDTMARPASSAVRGGPAVFYGHGGADDSFKKDEADRFLREVDSGLRELLAGRDLPMVLVGLDVMLSLYRDITSYPNVMSTAVRQNPDQLSTEQLHAAAWPIVESALTSRTSQALDKYHALAGTGQASSDEQTVRDAAEEGRIDMLFLAADRRGWEQEPGESAVVQLGFNGRTTQAEVLDRTATATLTTGGQAFVVPREAMPGGGDVAATFRY